MSTAGALRPIYVKETRALVPILAGCLTAMVVAVVPGPLAGLRASIAILAYVLGAVALGATAVGHEYSSQTLSTHLATPWTRLALFRVKAVALVACLAIHASAAWAVHAVLLSPSPLPPGAVASGIAGLWYLPLAIALFIAPALTMLFRGVLAGVVFTLAIPMSLWLAAMLATAWRVGANEASQEAGMLAAMNVLRYSGLTAAVVFAPVTWRLFRRLEATTAPLQIPTGSGVWAALVPHRPWHSRREARASTETIPPRRSRRPLRMLLIKELRLQQATFSMTALFAGISLVVMSLPMEAPVRTSILQSGTVLYLVLIAVMIGSLTSAEEREFGVIEAQALMPLPAWQSTFVKLTAALGLLLTLGVGVSGWLAAYGGYETPLRFDRGSLLTGRNGNLVEVLVVITLVGAYVSSITRGGLKAMLISLPILAGGGTALVFVRVAAMRITWEGVDLGRITRDPEKADALYQQTGLIARVDQAAWWLALGIVAATLLTLFHRNHRSSVLEPRHLRRQCVTIALCCLAGATLVGSAWPVTLWLLSDR